jgi:hypothetical protein
MASAYDNFLAFAAQAYGTDDRLLRAVNQLENSGRTTFDVNTWDSNAAAGHPSGGPFQFIKDTFTAYARHAREANPQAWQGIPMDWRDPRAQALAASWAFANGKGSAWSTYGKAKGMLGGINHAKPARVAPQAPSGSSPAMPAPGLDLPPGFLERRSPMVRMLLMQGSDTRAPISGRTTAPAGGFNWTHKRGQAGSYKDVMRLGKQFGLNVQGVEQTTGGHHAPGSYHYRGEAVDFGDATNSPAALQRFAEYARQHPGEFSEFFYNPAGFGIKDGKLIEGMTVAGHDDHLHAARSLRAPKRKGRFA